MMELNISNEEIACQELVELVTDYFDDTLPPQRRIALEEHLKVCSGCRNYIEQMRETIRLTGTLTQDAIPKEAQDQLLSIFRGWKQSSQS